MSSTAVQQRGWKTTKWQNVSFYTPLGVSYMMYATLTFSWKLSWRLSWHRTKTWFYTECGLALTPPPPFYFSCFNRFGVQAVFCLLTRYFSLCLFSCGIFIALARWVRLPSKLPYYFVIFPKLYFVFDFVPFFRFLTLSFSSQFLCSKVPWKRTGQSCPKRRDKENSCAGAEGELKDLFFMFCFWHWRFSPKTQVFHTA